MESPDKEMSYQFLFIGPQKNAVLVCCLLALPVRPALLLYAPHVMHIRPVDLLVYDREEWEMCTCVWRHDWLSSVNASVYLLQ